MNKVFVQNTKEWEELRKTKIGASDAPVIMEVSPWKTPYQLWEEKLGLVASVTTAAMKHGTESEEKARQCFENKTGLSMFPEVVFHPQYEWMMASLDGIDIERKHIVEIKRANKDDHALAKKGKVPDHYMPQLQHQLEVTGLDMAFYFSFDGFDGVIVEVARNSKYIKELVDLEYDFLKDLETFTPPKLSDKDFRLREDAIFKEWAEKYEIALEKLDSAEKEYNDIKDVIIALCDGKNTKCGNLKASISHKKGHIDYSKIPQLKDVDVDKYRKEASIFWRIQIGKNNTR